MSVMCLPEDTGVAFIGSTVVVDGLVSVLVVCVFSSVVTFIGVLLVL